MENKVIYLCPRFIIDEHFLEELFKDTSKAKDYIIKLKDIHINSNEYAWNHNIILDTSFKNAISDGKQVRTAGLLGAMHPEPFWHEEGLHSSVIKHSIAIADKTPYTVYILTNENESIKYLKNKHYSNYEKIKSAIIILHGQEALNKIDEVHSKIKEKLNC